MSVANNWSFVLFAFAYKLKNNYISRVVALHIISVGRLLKQIKLKAVKSSAPNESSWPSLKLSIALKTKFKCLKNQNQKSKSNS